MHGATGGKHGRMGQQAANMDAYGPPYSKHGEHLASVSVILYNKTPTIGRVGGILFTL